MQEFVVRFGDPECTGNELEKLVPRHLMEMARNDAQ